MDTTYTWNFEALETFPSYNGQQNVVYLVHWRLYANRTTDSGSYNTDAFGVQKVAPYTGGAPFIPFENLTETDVTGWVLDAMGPRYGELTASLNTRINDIINPPTLILGPPWVTPEPSPTGEYPPEPTPTPTAV